MSNQLPIQEVRDAVRNLQLDRALEAIKDLRPIDQADVLAQFDAPEAWAMLQRLPSRAEVFACFSAEQQVILAEQAPRGRLASIVREMAADERVDLFKRLNEEQQAILLFALAQADRDDIHNLVAHQEGTAGALMTSEFVAVHPDMTVEKALATVYKEAPDAETIYHVFVIDQAQRLVGVASLRELILAKPDSLVKDLMVQNVIHTGVQTNQEEVALLIGRYDLLALPITNDEDQLVGIVTYDDAMDAAREEATDDIHKSAGVTALISNVKDASISLLYKKRVFWLVLLVFGNVFSGMGIAHFEDIIESNIVLVFFLPLLVDSGGNAGSQSATLMVRALATGEVHLKNWFKLLGREALVAVALGVTMAAAVSFIGWYRGGMEIAFIVSLSMIVIVLIGCLIGMSLPFLLSRFGLDPASASAPLITSICDISGVVIYLYIATQFLELV